MNLITVILAVALLFVFLLLGGGLIVYIYWWLVQRPAPQHEGQLDLPELDAAVEILRDQHGIPHIYAQNEADLYRAQGFTHAQDRLWQMELNRRVAHGRLAELFGAAALDVDRFSRIVGFHRAAQAELDALDDATTATPAPLLPGRQRLHPQPQRQAGCRVQPPPPPARRVVARRHNWLRQNDGLDP